MGRVCVCLCVRAETHYESLMSQLNNFINKLNSQTGESARTFSGPKGEWNRLCNSPEGPQPTGKAEQSISV